MIEQVLKVFADFEKNYGFSNLSLFTPQPMKMFLLDLSFIGWDILCVFTFGIGYILLNPYKAQTKLEYINANILEVIK